jgi:hypothetical protein
VKVVRLAADAIDHVLRCIQVQFISHNICIPSHLYEGTVLSLPVDRFANDISRLVHSFVEFDRPHEDWHEICIDAPYHGCVVFALIEA